MANTRTDDPHQHFIIVRIAERVIATERINFRVCKRDAIFLVADLL